MERSNVDIRKLVIAGLAVALVRHAIRTKHAMHAAYYGDPAASGTGPAGQARHGWGGPGRGFRHLPPRMEQMLKEWHRAEHEASPEASPPASEATAEA